MSENAFHSDAKDAPTSTESNEESLHETEIESVADETADTTEATDPQGEIEHINYDEQIADLKDKMLRVAAESENVRRRAELDVAKARDFAIEGFAKDMVSVLDNLFRALESIPEDASSDDGAINNIKEGVEMTKKEMLNAFERHKISRHYPLHETFDHNIHQAMTQVPTIDHEAGIVVDVIQAGYTIKDRLLRPALVAVAKPES